MNNHVKEMEWRENIEWSNMWWEKAYDAGQKRIALLGDSVTRGFRSKLNNCLEGRYVVDICASSSQITDTLLWKEYKFFFDCNEWKYSKVLIHAGGQHGHKRQCYSDKEYSECFRESYKKLIDMISTYCSDLMIISYTPTVEKDNLKKANEARNRELIARDQIVSSIANELFIPYVDIWNPLLSSDHEHTDFIHFEDDVNEFIANTIMLFIQ